MREKMMDVVCDSIATDRCIAYCNYPHCGVVQYVVNKLIDNDIVQVVRCKDCKHYKNAEGCKPLCQKFEGLYGYPNEEDFCSYGERRTDATD